MISLCKVSSVSGSIQGCKFGQRGLSSCKIGCVGRSGVNGHWPIENKYAVSDLWVPLLGDKLLQKQREWWHSRDCPLWDCKWLRLLPSALLDSNI